MAEIKFEQMSQGGLVRMCEAKGLDHTGDREALIARLVAWEKSQSKEPEPPAEPPASEPED
ncbi:unnamed protein product [marine sediment metagenome]|uniref:SAP domain-containing protein n=1 Tax=marine sediment metagenome TaxID=412755 RepID=X1R177_9ZZZZ